MTYKLLKDDEFGNKKTGVIRTLDSAYIPEDSSNTDYQEYLAWVAKGNTAAAAD